MEMNIMKSLANVVEMEKSIAQMLSEFSKHISKTTEEASMDGVNKVGNGAVMVNSSNIVNGIICPSYYLQSIQASVVEKKLSGAKTATEFVERLNAMIAEQKVKIGNETVFLNNATLDVLRSYASTL
jgi:hypothetical protein